MRNRARIARALVRFYPLAWRARYEDEMLALLDVRPITLDIVLDVARGCAREHLTRPIGSVSPRMLRVLGGLMRIPAAGVLAVVIAWLGWFLANYSYVHGMSLQGLSSWGSDLRFLLSVRALAALLALAGYERLVLRRFEFIGWLAVGLVSVMLQGMHQIHRAFLPWNAFRDLGFEWADAVWPLFTSIMFLLLGTRRAVTYFAHIRDHRPQSPNVPPSILGLNR